MTGACPKDESFVMLECARTAAAGALEARAAAIVGSVGRLLHLQPQLEPALLGRFALVA